RVLKWVAERLSGAADAVDTPIGLVPSPDSLDVSGLDVTPEQLAAATAVDPAEWQKEIPLIEEWFASIGDKLPDALRAELDTLRGRLAEVAD
ncbi:MAG: phosphoenolpyruvate carboxykinase domain-containing protein, partial [Microlunatus sp.]|nr:phosphoenolpyruvate carboxykinase domain-containing protein [Microlunatus sp.]